MKRTRVGISMVVLGLLAASCGSSPASTPRKRNAALVAASSAMRVCVPAPKAQCSGAASFDMVKLRITRDFSGGDFSGMTFNGINVPGSVLEKANFSETHIDKMIVEGVRSANALFVNATIREMSTNVKAMNKTLPSKTPTADFSGTDFSFSNISESDLFGANLSNAFFNNAVLEDVELSNTNLTGVDLSRAEMHRVRAVDIVGTPLLPVGWVNVNGTLVGPDAKASQLVNENSMKASVETLTIIAKNGESLRPLTIEGSSCPRLWSSNFSSGSSINRGRALGSGKFGSTTLSHVDFSGVDLRGVDFSKMTLDQVNFAGANLANANFTDAKLNEVNFTYANLTSARFLRTQMKLIESGCTTGTPSVLPTGWTLVLPDLLTTTKIDGKTSRQVLIRRGFLVGPGSYFGGRNVAGLVFKNIETSAVEFSGSTNTHIGEFPLIGEAFAIGVASNQRFAEGWGVRKGILMGPGVDLAYANLADIDLNGINLAGADLDQITSVRISGTVTLPEGYKVAEGRIVGPSMNLDNQVFGSVDLTGVSLTATSLQKTDLSRANLGNVSSGGIKGVPLLPLGWKLFNGYILGPTANLEDAGIGLTSGSERPDLTNFDLSGARLSHTTMVDFLGFPKLPAGWFAVPQDSAFSKLGNVLIGPDTVLRSTITKLPPEYTLPVGNVMTPLGLIGPRMNLSQFSNGKARDFSGDIVGLDLTGSVIGRASFANAKFTNVRGFGVISEPETATRKTWPKGWEVRNKILLGPSANLEHADLTDMDLSNIDLKDANLNSARGSRIKFNAQTRLPLGWAIANGYLVGPQADLSDVFLSDVNLDGVDLSGANLSRFIGKRITGVPVLPKRYAVIRGYIVGADVDAVCSDVNADELEKANANAPLRANALLDSTKAAWKNNRQPCL